MRRDLNEGTNADQQESGQMLVSATLMLAVLLGMAAMTIDVGIYLHERRQLQNAADAAALAGAQELPSNPVQAEQEARDWAAQNGMDPGEIEEVTVESADAPNDTMSVTLRRNVGFFFARVLGLDQGPVSSKAKGQVGSLAGATGLVPFGVLDNVINLPKSSKDATNVKFGLFWLNPLQNGKCSGNNCEIQGYFIHAEVSVSGLLAPLDPTNTPFTIVKLVE